jgi:hypothetical protein
MAKRLGKLDFIFLGVLLLAGVILYAAFYLRSPSSDAAVRITVDGDEYGTFSLNEEQTVSICDADGNVTNVLTISGEKADMVEADCPDLLCVHQKAVSLNGETIVCLPNKVVVTVENSKEAQLDGISQ